jgi:dihydroorotate dehydrogenase (fumarate)
MNLATTYLGLPLRNPLIVGASPFADNLHAAGQLQDAGAAAIVMRSLFEEQITLEQRALFNSTESVADSSAEAASYFPAYEDYQLTPDHYLAQLGRLKESLKIPVIASLNGRTPGAWTEYAGKFERAGADAIELNLYQLVTDAAVSGAAVEETMLEVVRSVTATVKIPVSVKLSPFHSSLPHFVAAIEQAGAAGVVLFNRFYQPDFDIEALSALPTLRLSESSELLLRLRWLAILSPGRRASLAASGGVHTTDDIIKSLLAGANAVQLVAVLLKHGPRILTTLLHDLDRWATEHDYASLDELRGALNHSRCPDPAAFERANYQKILQSWVI